MDMSKWYALFSWELIMRETNFKNGMFCMAFSTTQIKFLLSTQGANYTEYGSYIYNYRNKNNKFRLDEKII